MCVCVCVCIHRGDHFWLLIFCLIWKGEGKEKRRAYPRYLILILAKIKVIGYLERLAAGDSDGCNHEDLTVYLMARTPKVLRRVMSSTTNQVTCRRLPPRLSKPNPAYGYYLAGVVGVGNERSYIPAVI